MNSKENTIIIADLAPLSAENIEEMTSAEVAETKGGAEFSGNFRLKGNDQLFIKSDGFDTYTYRSDDGNVTESGNRPANFDPETAFTPISQGTILRGSFSRDSLS